MTPEKAFMGVKLEVGHLHIFGYLGYIHVPKEKRSKLELSGKKRTFVGYSQSSKAYKVYLPRSRHIKISRDFTFEEDVAFKKARGLDIEIDEEECEKL